MKNIIGLYVDDALKILEKDYDDIQIKKVNKLFNRSNIILNVKKDTNDKITLIVSRNIFLIILLLLIIFITIGFVFITYITKAEITWPTEENVEPVEQIDVGSSEAPEEITEIDEEENTDVIAYLDESVTYPKEYTVTFINNGVVTKVNTVNNLVNEITVDDINGYTFEGWYDGENLYDFSTKIYKNKTLTAKYITNQYEVNYVANGISISDELYNYNSLVNKLDAPTKEGYTFIGWYLNNQLYDFNTPITNNIKLEAKYNINQYEINYYIDDTLNKTVQVNYQEQITKYIPEKNGYEFIGWYTKENKKYDFNNKVTNDINLYALFTRVNPTISLNLNDSYYIGTDENINVNITYQTTTANVEFVYVDSENTCNFISNINELKETGIYKITATVIDELGAIASSTQYVTITGPTVDYTFSDNKDVLHYYNQSITMNDNITNLERPIKEIKYYYSVGNVVDYNLVYEDNYQELNNLNSLSKGYYQIKMVATDELGYVFNTTKNISIDDSKFDSSKLPSSSSTITKVHFVTSEETSSLNDENKFDISAANDGTTYAWNENNELYISNIYSSYSTPYTNSLANLFKNYTALESIDFAGLNIENVIDLESMFDGDTKLTSVNLDELDTSKVQSMRKLFYKTTSLTNFDVSKLEMDSLKDGYGMFSYTGITDFDFTNTESHNLNNLYAAFSYLQNATSIDLTGLDTENVTNMALLFNGSEKLTTINLTGLNTSNVTTMKKMFSSAKLESTMAITNIIGLSDFDTSNVTDMSYMFINNKSLKTIDVSNFNTSNVKTMYSIFYNDQSLTSIDTSSWDLSNVTTTAYMFYKCINLPTVGDTSNWNTSKVTNMYGMFAYDSKLKELNTTNWDTSNVTNMSWMFSKCTSLTSLDVSNWNTSKVTKFSSMFSGNSYVADMKIKYLDVSNWDTSSAIDMTCMFYGMGAIQELDVSNWNVSKVQSFNHMFCDNIKLQSLDISKWNTESLLTLYNMFDDCKSLTTVGDISNWDVSNLKDAGGMFNGCTSFIGIDGTLDLSSWNIKNLYVTGEMFRATKLKAIDLSGWDISHLSNTKWAGTGSGIYYCTGNDDPNYPGMNGMFESCSSLTAIYVGDKWVIPSNVTTKNMFKNAGVSAVTLKS